MSFLLSSGSVVNHDSAYTGPVCVICLNNVSTCHHRRKNFDNSQTSMLHWKLLMDRKTAEHASTKQTPWKMKNLYFDSLPHIVMLLVYVNMCLKCGMRVSFETSVVINTIFA